MRQLLSSRVAPLLFGVLLLGATPATGQDLQNAASSTVQPPVHIELLPVDARVRREPAERPGALMPLYGSLIALQGLDIHSTRRGMSSGKTREANPLMESVAENSAALVVVKATATAGAIWCAEKLWKKHPKRAVVFAALLNATMAAVVAHNYRAAK